MRINPSVMSSAISRYDRAVRKPGEKEQTHQIKDKVDISEDAKTYNTLLKSASSDPASRQEKVERISDSVSKGNYTPDPKKILDAMLS